MDSYRSFHLGDILSITTGRLVSPRKMDGIYDILTYMTGGQLYSHQLLGAERVCKLHLLMQYPILETIDASNVNSRNWQNWIAEKISMYGEYLQIKPLILYFHENKDQFEKLSNSLT